jgi:hypothetical protein
VIGPVVLLFVAAAAFFCYRRRNRKHDETITTTVDTEKNEDDEQGKAQLHGDSVTVKRHELEGTVFPEAFPDLPWELPAREPVGTELQGRTYDHLENSDAR